MCRVCRVETKFHDRLGMDHGPSQSGPYSRVRDLLATLTLNFSLIARSSAATSGGSQGIDRLAALG